MMTLLKPEDLTLFISCTLQDLIRITAEGPPVSDFDATAAVDKWLARDRDAGERQQRLHFHISFSESKTLIVEKNVAYLFYWTVYWTEDTKDSLVQKMNNDFKLERFSTEYL